MDDLSDALWQTQTLKGLRDAATPETRRRFVGEIRDLVGIDAEKVAAFDRVKAHIDKIQDRDRYALVNINQIADLLKADGMWSHSFHGSTDA